MSVNLLEVMSAARSRAASVVAEVAGYLVLGAADQVAGAPRALGAADILLSAEGTLAVRGGSAAADPEAAAALRSLLSRLIAVSASVTPALLRVTQREAGGGVCQLVKELEAALIPVNRAAARRAMSRLYRDVARAKSSGRLSPAPFDDPVPIEAAVPAPAPAEVVAHNASADPCEPILEVLAEEIEIDAPSPEVPAVEEPATAPEPVVTRRRSLPPPLPPSEPVELMPEVPDLEVPSISASALPPVVETRGASGDDPGATATPALGSLAAEAPADLEPAEVTDPAPELEPDYEPLNVVTPEPTPALMDLVQAARAMRLAPPAERPLEVTAPLPPAAPPAAPAEVQPIALPDYEPLDVGPRAEPLLAFEAPEPPEPEAPDASPIAPMPVVALERRLAPPPRPRVFVPAPPRYEPKQSDVDQLLESFSVSQADDRRALCADLKKLAGVDRTELPPAVSTATPPPVETADSSDATRPGSKPRIGLGALAVLAGVIGLGAISMQRVASADRAASAPPDVPCEATLAVSGVPAGAQALVRAGDQGNVMPTRSDRDQAIFAGLRCREPLELTVATESGGKRRWIRIPVSAEAMTPSESVPSEVRVAIRAR